MANRVNTWIEHNIGSTGAAEDAAYVVVPEWLYSVQDTSVDGPTTISATPALLGGVYVNTVLSAHTVLLTDGSTTVITLPASLAAGTFIPLWGIKCATSLKIDPNDSSTGNITVLYRPL